MRTWIVCAAIIAGVLPACTDDGGTCEAPQLAPVEENASGRALSCVEQVALDGVTYAPWCAQVLDERLGARVGEGQGYAAISSGCFDNDRPRDRSTRRHREPTDAR